MCVCVCVNWNRERNFCYAIESCIDNIVYSHKLSVNQLRTHYSDWCLRRKKKSIQLKSEHIKWKLNYRGDWTWSKRKHFKWLLLQEKEDKDRERESDHGEVKSKMGAQPLKRYIWNTYVLYTHSQIAGGLRYRVRKKMCTHTHKHIHQTHDKEVTSVLAHLFHFKGGISLTRCNSRTHSTDVYDSISK